MDLVEGVCECLVSVRDVVMRVNAEYIASAAQADEFRTEPPFRLQGSYRNMNRLAEKVAAIQNDAEVQALVLGHYRGESQTLTTGAEANLLKFRELMGLLTAEESVRWEEIRKTFRRNQYTRGTDQNDPVGRVVAQLSLFQSGLESIQSTLAGAASRPPAPVTLDIAPLGNALELLRATLEERLGRPHSGSAPVPVAVPDRPLDLDRIAAGITEGLKALGETLSHARPVADGPQVPARIESLSHELEMIHSTLVT